MTMPSTRLFGRNLEFVTELILVLHFHVLLLVGKVVPHFLFFSESKEKSC